MEVQDIGNPVLNLFDDLRIGGFVELTGEEVNKEVMVEKSDKNPGVEGIHVVEAFQKVEGFGTGTVFEKNGTREVGEEIEVKWSKMYKKFYVVKPKKEEKEA